MSEGIQVRMATRNTGSSLATPNKQGAGFVTQLKALVYRNLIYKKRSPVSSVMEFFIPIALMLVLVILKLVIPSSPFPAVDKFPVHSLNQQKFQPDSAKVLMVAPDSSQTRQILDMILPYLDITVSPKYEMFTSENETIETFRKDPTKYSTALIFSDDILLQPTYKVRSLYGLTLLQRQAYISMFSSDCRQQDGLAQENCAANQYLFNGQAYLQVLIEQAMMAMKTNVTNITFPDIGVQMMPVSEYTPSPIWLQSMLAVYFPFLLFPALLPVMNILTFEKKENIKQSFNIMGMKNSAHWISWWSIYMVIITILSLILTGMMFAAGIFVKSSFGLIFLFILMSCYAWLQFVMVFGAIFTHPQAANGIFIMSSILFSSLYFAILIPRMTGTLVPTYASWILSILPPSVQALGIDQAYYLELWTPGGLQSDTLTLTTPTQNFAMSYAYLMVFIDILLYGFLGYYIENIRTGGKTVGCCFFLKRAYWCSSSHKDKDYSMYENNAEVLMDFEPVSSDMQGKEAIRIYGVVKKFRGEMLEKKSMCAPTKYKDNLACDNISLDLYEGHITALLGHNGAGKTTLISIITGILGADKGTATIYGQDVSDYGDLSRIKNLVGLCPQHDLVIRELSVYEHLTFVAKLKGIPEEKKKKKKQKAASATLR